MKPLRLLSVLVLFGLVGGTLYYHSQKPRVFILHSYEPDYVWTEGVNDGLERVTEGWSDVHLNTHYMFTKRFDDPDALRRAAVQAENAIERWQPEIVIATDNLAHSLVMKYHVDQPGISIVFAGINGPITPFGYDTASNVAGILEDRSLGPARDAIEALRTVGEPRAPWDGSRPIRVRYMLDNSRSVQADRPKIDAFDWAPLEYVGSISVTDFPGWQAEAIRSGEIADVIIVTNYRQLHRSSTDKTFVPPQEVLTWTEANAGIPVVGLNFFGTVDGATFSVGTSPIEQGQVSAGLAADIIAGGEPGELGIRPNVFFLIAMSGSRLARHGLELPSIYEAFARATDTYLP